MRAEVAYRSRRGTDRKRDYIWWRRELQTPGSQPKVTFVVAPAQSPISGDDRTFEKLVESRSVRMSETAIPA
jgi:hypothetical protein